MSCVSFQSMNELQSVSAEQLKGAPDVQLQLSNISKIKMQVSKT